MSDGYIHPTPVYARKASDKPRQSTNGEYLAVPLPDLISDIGFAEGDSVYMTLSSTEFEGRKMDFLKVSKEEIGRHKLKIRQRSDLKPPIFLSIPIEYTFHREDQGFHGLQVGETLVVEVDFDNECVNVFRGDYVDRMKQIHDGQAIPLGYREPVNDVPIAAGKFVPKNRFRESSIKTLDDPPDRVEVGEEIHFIVQIYGLGLRGASIKFKEEDEQWWNDKIWFRDIEGEFLDLVVRHRFREPGEYKFRILSKLPEGKQEKFTDLITVVESSE